MNTVALRQSIIRLEQRYGPEVTQLAALVHTARKLYGNASDFYKVNTKGLLKTLDTVIESHLIDREIYPPLLHEALKELERDLPDVAHPH